MFATKKYERNVNRHVAFIVGLRALSHPYSLLAIGVLLLNDHVLKHMAPSALTGKLSDFAGLFFFPFFLMVVLGALPTRWRDEPHEIARVAFGLTAVWFTLMKTTLWLNGISAELYAILYNQPVQIMRDSSDCFALLSLLPAWRLWQHCQQHPIQLSPRLSVVILAIASLAVMATQAPVSPAVYYIKIIDDRVYAVERATDRVFVSDDGFHWEFTETNPTIEDGIFKRETQTLACSRTDPEKCYQRSDRGNPTISFRSASDEPWQIEWEAEQQREFFQRKLVRFRPNNGTAELGWASDIAWLETAENSVVVVAYGTEGVLVKSGDQPWQQVGVGIARPVPLRAETSTDLFNVLGTEISILLFALPIAYYALSKILSGRVANQLGITRRQLLANYRWQWPLWLSAVQLIIGLLLLGLNGISFAPISPVFFTYVTGAGMFFGLLYAFFRLRTHSYLSDVRQLITPLSLALLTVGAPLLILVLWASSVITRYNTALYLALISGGLIFMLGAWLMNRWGDTAKNAS